MSVCRQGYWQALFNADFKSFEDILNSIDFESLEGDEEEEDAEGSEEEAEVDTKEEGEE